MEVGEQTEGDDTPNNPFDDEFIHNGTYVLFDCDGFKEMGIEGVVFLVKICLFLLMSLAIIDN